MLTKDKKLLFIGEVAARSGIPIKTIRYYEEFGLLKLSGRTKGGYRQFSSDVFSRLNFIKQTQSLGLTLQEIGELLRIYDLKKPLTTAVKQQIQERISLIDRQIEKLRYLQSELRKLLAEKITGEIQFN